MFDGVIDDVRSRETEFVVYTGRDDPEVAERFAEYNVSVSYRGLPPAATEEFLVIRESGAFAGSIGLDELDVLLEPPIDRPIGSAPGAHRALFDVLDDTVFTPLDRRQLLATSREIEDRAFRVGRGTLRVGFQNAAAFRRQRRVYERLAAETELDIHVYGHREWPPDDTRGLTVHEASDAVDRYWFLAFDGGDDERQACGLVARQTDGAYTGFWTYDPGVVGDILDRLAALD
jgi:hypothetical protein